MHDDNSTGFDPAWDRPIWGADAMAAESNVKPRRMRYLLQAGLVDADKLGDRWVSTRRRLLGKIARPKVEAEAGGG